jgi:hypothetical protein
MRTSSLEMEYVSPSDRSNGMTRVALGVAAGVLLLWFLLAPFAWLLRDGLGPNSVESHGLTAIARAAWTFCWGPIAAVLAFLVLVLRRVTSTAVRRHANWPPSRH